MMRGWLVALCALGLVLEFGCSKEESAEEETARYTPGAASQQRAERGAEIFKDKNFGEAYIACADCHNDFPDSLGQKRIMPGHSILGAAARRSTWYGEFSGDALERTAAGAAKCALVYQLRGTTLANALTEDEAASLMDFYKFISTGNEARMTSWAALSYPGDPKFKKDSIIAIVDSLNNITGDPGRGEVLFNKTCAHCHSGTADAIAPHPRMLRKYTHRVFLFVRAGKANMPFFSYDKLSNKDVADIKEWVRRGAR